MLRQHLILLDLEGVLIQADSLHTRHSFFGSTNSQEHGAYFLLTCKANQARLHRQVRSQFQGKRKIPYLATNHEISHGRDITWSLDASQTPQHIREAWTGSGMALG